MIILLDAGPLGLITNPAISDRNEFARAWLSRLVRKGAKVVVPEICDYAVRRELIRVQRIEGIQRLNALKTMLSYAPITTSIMLRAAEYWARARQQGRATADDTSLDADMILAAQAW